MHAGGGDDAIAATPILAVPTPVLKFAAVSRDLADRVVVPAGYTATVIYATGDSIDAAVTDYKNDGTDSNFARRSGEHHDGMHYFGLTADGKPTQSSNDRALMAINHEAINGTVQFMHPNGQTNIAATAGPRPARRPRQAAPDPAR